jgi:homoaconitase
MKQDLPNLVDERRFRRREPDQFERDEFGRVIPTPALLTS